MKGKFKLHDFKKRKLEKKKICALTAYDYCTANWLQKSCVDFILVGDSAGMVVYGSENTLCVKVNDILRFCKAVRKGARETFIVADMPFLSYQLSREKAVKNAGKLIAEGGADAVKIEGGLVVKDKIEAVLSAGMAVQGHLGLTPQSVSRFGGYKVQGRTLDDAAMIVDDAKMLEDLGVFSLVLEFIPFEVAEKITSSLTIPTIGIGSGGACDGQILVTNDLLGLTPENIPRFARKYAEIGETISGAASKYIEDVRSGNFPSEKETVRLQPEEADEIDKL